MTVTASRANEMHYAGRSNYSAPKALRPVVIDGVADEAVWAKAGWQELTHRWLGPEYSAEDFQGRYKVAWSDSKLYIDQMVELGGFADWQRCFQRLLE